MLIYSSIIYLYTLYTLYKILTLLFLDNFQNIPYFISIIKINHFFFNIYYYFLYTQCIA